MNLEDSVLDLPLIGPSYAKKLEKLGITTIKDILEHVPHRYLDFSKTLNISSVRVGDIVTIKGEIISFKNQYTRMGRAMQILTLADKSGKVDAIWFNQPFLSRTFRSGMEVSLAGKLDFFGKKVAFLSPEYEIAKDNVKSIHTGRIIPVYPETAGVSSKWLRRRIQDTLEKESPNLDEFLPNEVLEKHKLVEYKEAITSIHLPKSLDEAETGKRRLAFNELLMLHLANIERKRLWQKQEAAHKLVFEEDEVKSFINSLPFTLTASQATSIKEILEDIRKNVPMNRLLEGDVGSGKTAVAAAAAFATFSSGFQTVVMAPTQILAAQHFETLNKLFDKYKIRISLITSQKKDINVGTTDVFVGTHALIESKLNFSKVGLVVIDEQHRFGVEQRTHLVKKTKKGKVAPHVLTMTATPIPRTVALTLFGDLELSTLSELPKGRQKITTWVVGPEKRDAGYTWVYDKIKKEATQAFVVCPLIEVSDKETMTEVKAATAEYERIKNLFPKLKVSLLHGKMKAEEKDDVIEDFRNGKVEMLVSTPVIEVGVDIPNATMMVIEAADRFGLASLHQLRGRVGRGKDKSYCILMSESKSEKSMGRLNAMTQTYSGFELAELDLKMRGPGEIFGTSQSGFPELKVADWADIELIKETKDVAQKYYPLLLPRLKVKY